jgi:Holliday junction resolvasome RuvABC endonuclease subunit
MGIDCSSKTCAASVLSHDGNFYKLIHHDFVQPKTKNLGKDLVIIGDFLKKMIDEYEPDRIALEDIIKCMSGGRTSAQVITKLAGVNRVCIYVCTSRGYDVKLRNVLHTRKLVAGYVAKKEDMPDICASVIDMQFPWILDKKGNKKEENFDIADSMAIALSEIIEPG